MEACKNLTMTSSAVSTSFSKCPVCQETPLQEPRVLPCKHTVCTDCLQQYVASGSTKESADCPTCGTSFKLSNQGVNELPVAEKSGSPIEELCESLHQCTAIDTVQLGELKQQVSLETNTDICGIVAIEGCVCITVRGMPHIYLWDPIKGYRTTEVPHVHSLHGIALLSFSHRLVVLLDKTGSTGKLHYVKITAELSITHLRVEEIAFSNPFSINLSDQTGELLISGEGPAFAVCSLEGNVRKWIAVGNDSKLECVLSDSDSYVVTMSKKLPDQHHCFHEYSPTQLQWVDENGKQAGAVGGKVIKCGPHMIHDHVGRILATDKLNNRVILVDNTGCNTATKFLLSKCDDIKSPHYLHLHNNLLYIAHFKPVDTAEERQKSVTTAVSTFELCS